MCGQWWDDIFPIDVWLLNECHKVADFFSKKYKIIRSSPGLIRVNLNKVEDFITFLRCPHGGAAGHSFYGKIDKVGEFDNVLVSVNSVEGVPDHYLST